MTVRVVDQSEEKCETKALYRGHFPAMPAEFPYTRKVVLCFLDVAACPVVFFGCGVGVLTQHNKT